MPAAERDGTARSAQQGQRVRAAGEGNARRRVRQECETVQNQAEAFEGGLSPDGQGHVVWRRGAEADAGQ